MDRKERKRLGAVWRAMKGRCHNPRVDNYPRYGAQGIVVCKRWRDSFAAFLKDMGPCPPGFSIERRDNDGNYTPKNCCWAPDSVQRRNRSDNRILTLNGRSMVLKDWSTETGILVGTLWNRLMLGWSDERTLTEPVCSAQRRYIKFDGLNLHVGEWSRRTGIQSATIIRRLNAGWSTRDVLTKPLREW